MFRLVCRVWVSFPRSTALSFKSYKYSGGREEVVANRTISLVLEWNQSSKDRRSVMIVQDDDMLMGKKINVEPFLSVSKIETNIIFLNLHSVTNSDSENWNNE
jgi:hypothetical protein